MLKGDDKNAVIKQTAFSYCAFNLNQIKKKKATAEIRGSSSSTVMISLIITDTRARCSEFKPFLLSI